MKKSSPPAARPDQARRSIGGIALRAPDFWQLQRWAAALDLTPEALLTILQASQVSHPAPAGATYRFCLQDGAIHTLVWDFARLPIPLDAWAPGLSIERLVCQGGWPGGKQAFRPELPGANILICHDGGLARLDLRGVPRLELLACDNRPLARANCPLPLKHLDLTPVPRLRTLHVGGNQLRTLSLAPVPDLRSLDCSANELVTLDLTPVPVLQTLECAPIGLTALDLRAVPELTILDCAHNALTDLDLRPAPDLSDLLVANNALTALDLTPLSGTDAAGLRGQCPHGVGSHPGARPERARLWGQPPDLPGPDADAAAVDVAVRVQLHRATGVTPRAPARLAGVRGQPPHGSRPPPLPALRYLGCSGNRLLDLDLAPVPGLQELVCANNGLVAVDLTGVPALEALNCCGNRLTTLDLTPVPPLRMLLCPFNRLRELDLTPADPLRVLCCADNPLPGVRVASLAHAWALEPATRQQLEQGSGALNGFPVAAAPPSPHLPKD